MLLCPPSAETLPGIVNALYLPHFPWLTHYSHLYRGPAWIEPVPLTIIMMQSGARAITEVGWLLEGGGYSHIFPSEINSFLVKLSSLFFLTFSSFPSFSSFPFSPSFLPISPSSLFHYPSFSHWVVSIFPLGSSRGVLCPQTLTVTPLDAIKCYQYIFASNCIKWVRTIVVGCDHAFVESVWAVHHICQHQTSHAGPLLTNSIDTKSFYQLSQ